MSESAISDEELAQLLMFDDSGGDNPPGALPSAPKNSTLPAAPAPKAPERTLSQAEIDAMLAALANQ